MPIKTQNTKRRHLLILTSIIIGSLFSFSHYTDPLEKIIAGFNKYLDEKPQEKIYIHFDRPYYSTGETIWFKAYLTAGAYHQPSLLSNTIYVELINEHGQFVQNLKLFSINGSTAGSILIPDSLAAGNYLVRAYTNWMRNSGEEYFFHRSLKIWDNKISANNTDTISNTSHLDIQFFPEGGELVNGIYSKVAFKAIGTDGLGRKVSGKVTDGSNVICEFKSNSLGMGAFLLTPQKDKQYKAIIENYENEIALPKSKESGLTLSVNNSSSSNDITVKIQTTDYTNFRTIYIVAQTRGIVCYSARANLSTNIAVAKIPKAEIPSGVTQITVTDQNGTPLAERLIFVDQKDHLTFTITTNKTLYAPRELVNLDIQATDASGKPIVTDLSLSICDTQQVLIDENSESINSYLLLSSELIGHIESPGYYFNSDNEDREEAMDYLLLTQGWRRFTFKDALEQKWEHPLYKVEQGLTIKGKLVDPYNNKPVIGGEVSYLSVFPIPEAKTVTTNSKGEFEVNNIIYFDSTDALLQGATKRGNKSVKILVENSADFPSVKFPLFHLNETQNEFEKAFIAKSVERKTIDRSYNFDEKTIILDAVEVRAKREDTQNTGSKIFGRGSTSIKVSGNPSLENQLHPLQLIQGRVAGVQVTGSGQNWSVLIRGVNSINSGTTPLIMVDDMPVQIETLHTIPVQEIESFTVWKGPDAAIFGSRGANGAIGFYTKRGSGVEPPRESSVTFLGTGFHIEREFYAPKYDVQEPEHIKPDNRVTLFWAPYIQTDSSGRASISFYNHDVETTITGTLEGISATGSSGSLNFEYKIIKD
ncbi:MAG: TonB-dependent receptor plug domain-containing protein [Cyclobacteriaceae bacterium]|nr:TonB-dependent receptor plug domain-containing protein [Cyclobacteriaceae bacterium]